MLCSVKSTGLPLLIFSYILYLVDSHPNSDPSYMGCGDCRPKRNEQHYPISVYQCHGCCFSRAYPTSLETKKNMVKPKNITLEATCCVARDQVEIQNAGLGLHDGERLMNHTSCHCSDCRYHKA